MTASSRPRIALMVDGDQHLTSLRGIVEAASARGEVRVREVFALWGQADRSPWVSFAERLGFVARSPSTSGREATDLAMAERVRELLAEGVIDEYWIASSDRGFVPLARQILERDRRVEIVLATAQYPPDLRGHLRIADHGSPLPAEWQEEVRAALRGPYARCAMYERGVLLSELNQRLMDGKFSPKHYGAVDLIGLLRAMPADFEIADAPAGGAVHVRMA